MLRYYNFPFFCLAGMINGRWFCSEILRWVRFRWWCLAPDYETSHIYIITFRSVNLRTATGNGTESTMARGTNSSKKMLRSSIHRIRFCIQQDYIHEVPVILHDNLQRVSQTLRSFVTHVIARTMQTDEYWHVHHFDCRKTELHTRSPDFYRQPRLANVTSASSLGLCGITPAILG